MEGLSTLLQSFADLLTPIVKFLIWAWPVKVYPIQDGEGGIILTLGKVRRKRAEKGPGVHLCGPFEEMQVVQVMGEYINLEQQAVRTKDGKVVLLNGAVEYSIVDLKAAILETSEHENLIMGVSQNEIREYAREHDLEDIVDADKLGPGLATKVNRKIKSHGVKVVNVMLTDLRPHDMTMLCDTAQDIVDKFKKPAS